MDRAMQQESSEGLDAGRRAVIEALLPAPTGMWVDASLEPGLAALGIDALWVQGRGDRLHGLVRWRGGELGPRVGEVACNWLWLVVDSDSDVASVQQRADALGAGVLRVGTSVPERVRGARPRPGIFLPRWPLARAAWKKLSDW